MCRRCRPPSKRGNRPLPSRYAPIPTSAGPLRITRRTLGTGTHNPLVPDSSPDGSTNIIDINSLWVLHRGSIVPLSPRGRLSSEFRPEPRPRPTGDSESAPTDELMRFPPINLSRAIRDTSAMENLHKPLTESEFDLLEAFLLDRIDDESYTDGMDEGLFEISGLDGFFTAIVSGPATILPSQWMPSIWGDFEPEFQSEQEAQTIVSLLMRLMNSCALILMEEPEDFEPMFYERTVEGKTHTIVDEWCEGYMRGVSLAADQWAIDSAEMQKLLSPIIAFTTYTDLDVFEEYTEQEIAYLRQAITSNARKIHAHWLSHRGDQHRPAQYLNAGPKVGRNDPCPCGSGKKYKKCCLQ